MLWFIWIQHTATVMWLSAVNLKVCLSIMDELSTLFEILSVVVLQFCIAVATSVKVSPSAAGRLPADLHWEFLLLCVISCVTALGAQSEVALKVMFVGTAVLQSVQFLILVSSVALQLGPVMVIITLGCSGTSLLRCILFCLSFNRNPLQTCHLQIFCSCLSGTEVHCHSKCSFCVPKTPQMSVWAKACSACTQPRPLSCSIHRIRGLRLWRILYIPTAAEWQFCEHHNEWCDGKVWRGCGECGTGLRKGQAQEKSHGSNDQFCLCYSLSYQLRFFSCISKSVLFLLAASSLLCRLFCCEAVNVSSCLFGGIRKKSVSTHSELFP